MNIDWTIVRPCFSKTLTAAALFFLAAFSILALAPSIGAQDQTTGATDKPAIHPSGLLTELPVYDQWRSFSVADGLPSAKIFCVRVDGDTVWAGTDRGLARLQDGKWKVYGVADGLPHRAVLSLDISPQTGDLWIGTMDGLARFSAGRFDIFNQNNSGLSNNFVNDIECDPDQPHVWVATAMGACRLDLGDGSWSIFTHENTPMHEPWTYSISIDRGRVYIGAWGAGILEYQKDSSRWREYRDPDKEMDLDLLPNDGPVHDVTASVEFRGGMLWQATYVGLARYDGRRWWSYFKEDSGLISNFINFVRSRGRVAWLCTDQGLNITDGQNWLVYRRTDRGKGEFLSLNGQALVEMRRLSAGPAHNFILGVDFQGNDVWLATEGGVSHGWAQKHGVSKPTPAIPSRNHADTSAIRNDFKGGQKNDR